MTPEAVLLEFRAAGLGSRILAKALDTALQSMVFGLAMVPFAFIVGGSGAAAAIYLGLVSFAVLFGYPVSEAFMSGQTPGKKMLGIRVVTTEGGPEQFRHAAVRALIGTIEFALPPGGAMAMISALVSRRSQRVGDMAAGTIVVRLERSMPQPLFFPVVWGHEHFSERFDAGGMTKDQFAVLRDYMLRYRHLSADAASHLSRSLAEGLQRSGATPRPAQMSYEHYLMAAVFAYQQRFSFADGSTQAPVIPLYSNTYGTGLTTAAPPPPRSGYPMVSMPPPGSVPVPTSPPSSAAPAPLDWSQQRPDPG